VSRTPGRVIIIGAGPTGLGVAYRLEELGHTDYVVLERAAAPGGLAASVTDAAGYTWDIGGHVQFSHYAYYDRAIDRAVDAWLTHERESWIWIRGRWVPYPFQNNLHRLDEADCRRALEGLEKASAARAWATAPPHFGEWISQTFGAGLADLFLRPYNVKVWGYPLDRIGVGWMGERVAVPDVDRIRRNVATGQDDVSWGPNRTFRFPLEGGTGAIWRGVSGLLPAERQRFGAAVVAIDDARKEIALAGGGVLAYDTLVSTMPLDRLCALVPSLSQAERDLAGALCHSSVHIVGVGLEGPRPETLARKCWMYFPEANSPYYRVTVFSNYSPRNVPAGDCWSLMAEVCESPAKPVDGTRVAQDVVEALRDDGLLLPETRVASVYHHREEHGYPTPFVGRDEVIDPLRVALDARGIFSRGRFGAWKYEVSNQDHSFMQGVELADRLVLGAGEVTVVRPDEANSGIFLRQDDRR
jgi:protoporphyrinogen oxidase